MKKILPFSFPILKKTKPFFTRISRLPRSLLAACLIVLTVLVGSGIIFFLIPYLSNKDVEAAWYNDNWSYRQIIGLTKGGGVLTNTQIAITMDTATLISAGKLQPNCADLRFTAFNGTVLNHFTDLCSSTANINSVIWVNVDNIASINSSTVATNIYAYYGNASAPSTSNWIGNTLNGANPGSGGDGACSVTSDTNINTGSCVGRSSGDAIVSAVSSITGTGLVTVASVTGFSVNDEILIINLQGTSGSNSGVGLYEFARISTLSSTTLTLNHPLANTYDPSTQKIVVQRVPNYTNVTTSNAGTDFTPSAWNGTSGGVMAFRANGTVTVNSSTTINSNALGYRGGAGGASGSFGGINAESYDGTSTAHGGDGTTDNATQGAGRSGDNPAGAITGAARSGGAGGGSDGSADGNGSGGAGGGGGHAGGGGGGGGGAESGLGGGNGGSGGTSGTSAGGGGGACGTTAIGGHNGGNAGSAGSSGNCSNNGTAGAAGSGTTSGGGGGGGTSTGSAGAGGGGGGTFGSTSILTFGGGGGGGGASSRGPVTGQAGTAGGGIVIISATTVTVSGNISATGGAATLSASVAAGGGGGGAGGSILVNASTFTMGSSLVTGTGGAASTGTTGKSGGGAGGNGRIVANYNSSSGSTNPGASQAQIAVASAPATEEKSPTAVGYWKFDEGTGTLAKTSTTPGFSPKDMTGLALWLDASAQGSIQTQTGVSQWSDLSGNSRHFTQATTSRQPAYVQGVLNGKPVIQTTAASQQHLANTTNFSTPNTVLYVSRQTGGTNARMLTSTNDNWLMGYWSGYKQQAYFNGWIYGPAAPGTLSDTTWHLFSSTQSGAASSFYENGTALVSGSTAGVTGPNGLQVGCYAAAASECSDGQFAEVIVFNRVLSDNERNRVEAYLNQKWGLGISNLVNTNPYYNQTAPNTNDGILNNFASPPSATSGWQTEDQCISGKCLRFDGTNDYVDLGDSPSLQPTNVSVGAWFKTTSTSGMMLVRKRLYGYGLQMGDVGTVTPGAGKLSFWTVTSTPTFNTASSTATYNDGKWHYAEGTYDGSNVRLYVDGILIATTAAGTMHYTADAVTIGRDAGAASSYFNGTMDEVRIYPYTRSAAQVAADYNARSNGEGVSQQQGNNTQNMPAALSNGLQAYWKMDEASWNGTSNEVIDSSGSGNNGTSANGATTAIGKFANAGTFDDTNDTVSIGAAKFDTISNGTIAFWLNQNSSAGNHPIFTHYVDINNRSSVYYNNTTGKMVFEICVSGTCTSSLSSVTSITTGTWTHVTATFGSNGMKIYLNGKLDATSTDTTAYTSIGTSTSNHIASINGGIALLNGKVDELRIYNRALSDDDIALLYNWAPGPVGYWDFEENPSTTTAYDRSGYSNNGTWTGTTAVSAPGKYGKAGVFNGSSNYVSVPAAANSSLDIVNAVTIEAWVKPGLANQDVRIFNRGQYATRGYGLVQAGTQFNLGQNGASNFSAGPTIVAGQWYHVVGVVNNTASQIWVNGVLVGTGTVNVGGSSTSDPAQIGAEITSGAVIQRYFNGSIDEVKIYNYPRSASQIVEDYNAGHPSPGSPIGSATLHWKFNEGFGTTANNSGGGGTAMNGTLTNISSPATSTSGWTTAGKINKAINFGGNGDKVTTTGLADAYFTNSWTQTLWIKTLSVANNVITEKGANIAFIQIFGGQVRAGTLGTGGNYFDTTGAPLVNDNNWHHVAVTYNGDTNLLTTYIDGINRGSLTTSSDASSDSTAYAVGARGVSTTFIGSLDEVKVYNSALSEEQVKLEMNQSSAQVLGTLSSTQTVPTAAASEYCIPGDSTTCTSPIGRWDLEEGTGTTANDASGNANTGNITAGTGGYTVGKIGKGYSFDGANTLINAGSGTSLDNLPAAGMTAEVWYYPRSLGESSVGFILSKNTGASQNQGWFLLNLGTNALQFVVDGSTDLVVQTSTNAITLNRWNHIALSWNGNITTASSVDIYVNGVETSYVTQTNGASRVDDAASSFYIGNASTSDRTIDGITDNVKLFNYARTSSQIAWDYNQGKPRAYLKLDECQGVTLNDSSGNSHTGTLTATSTVGTCNAASTFWGGASSGAGKRNYAPTFNGTGDYITLANPTLLPANNAAQSLSAWFNYPSTPGSTATIISLVNTGSSSITALQVRSGNIGAFKWGGTSLASVAQPAANTWHHVVYTFDGTTHKLYLNGILRNSTATAANTAAVAAAYIGDYTAGGGERWPGLLDDVKVYNYGLTDAQAKTLYNDGVVRYGPVTGAP